MREQARFRTEAGQFAVHATVEDVGRDNLESALGLADRERLATWRDSHQDGWFFVDSIDEAKLSGVRLERAIRRLGEGIIGAERRAHVILAGRLTDWEFRRDLKLVSSDYHVERNGGDDLRLRSAEGVPCYCPEIA
jgi:hypothetical protein